MAANGISTENAGDPLDTKLQRRADKLALASAKRNTLNTPGYRTLNAISGSFTAYVNALGGANLVTEYGTNSPAIGHPWVSDDTAGYMVIGTEDGNELSAENSNLLGLE